VNRLRAGSIQSQEKETKIYAIVESGGKQYRVTSGQVVDVDRMEAYEGDTVEMDRVLLIAGDNDDVTVGTPVIDGAKVTATCQGEKRTKKILVLHYKPKRRYHKKNGHRQSYTRLLINDIIGPGAEGETTTEPNLPEKAETEEVTENGA
jgi:large subunit ribosomal protein L21